MATKAGTPLAVDLESDDELSLMQQEGLALIARADTVREITTPAEMETAKGLRGMLREQIEGIRSFFKPRKKRWDDGHRAEVADERRVLQGPETALGIVTAAILAYEKRLSVARALAEARAAQESAQTGMPVPAAAVPKIEGLSFPTTWKAEVVDFALLVKSVAAGTVQLAMLQPHEAALNDLMRASKGTAKIPGVQAVEVKHVRG